MTEVQINAIAKLREQQSKQEKDNYIYYAANQLIGICAREPRSAEILCADLDNPDMDIVHAEAQIHALADESHKRAGRNCVCVCLSDTQAEAVLRKFYGLPDAPDAVADALPGAAPMMDAANVTDALPPTTPAPLAVTGSFADFL